MKLLNEQDFDSAVNQSSIMIVDFFADWCGPCKMLAPFIEELSAQYTDIGFSKVNVDNAQSLAAKFQISSIPTLIFFKNGKEIKRVVGFKPMPELEALIEEVKKA